MYPISDVSLNCDAGISFPVRDRLYPCCNKAVTENVTMKLRNDFVYF